MQSIHFHGVSLERFSRDNTGEDVKTFSYVVCDWREFLTLSTSRPPACRLLRTQVCWLSASRLVIFYSPALQGEKVVELVAL